jgi:hypothetical protein
VEWVASSLLLELVQSLIGWAFPASLRRLFDLGRRLALSHPLGFRRRLGGGEQGAGEDGDDCGEGTHFRGELWKEWVSIEEGLKGLFDDFELEK